MSFFHNIARVTRRLHRRMFRRQADVRTRDIIEALDRVPAFATCTQSTLRAVAESMHRRTYRREEHIYYEGDPGLGLYIIQQGRVRLLAEEKQETVVELGHMGPHEMFGTLSIFGDFRRLETAQAMTEASVLGFFRPDLKSLTKRNPQAGAELTVALARHLAEQHVDLIGVMADRLGRASALSAFAEAATRAEAERAAEGW